MYFTSGRIKKCESCVDPNRSMEHIKLNTRREEIEKIRKKEEDKGWYAEPFRSEWRDHLASFSPIRMLLFETIMDRRPRRADFMMQATDIVMRTPESEFDIEFGQFSRARIFRAKKRLQGK
jgi:hypothetical protein